LRDRGDITLWISQDAIEAWTPPQTGKRGAQPVYSDLAIETALTFRLLFHLALRQTEGFLGSVLQLMDLTLLCPDHTTLSRRNAAVEVRRQVDRAPQGPVDLIVDSTGLKVRGQGEWHAQKHGEKKGKRWKKLHIGVDDQGQILVSTVSESKEHPHGADDDPRRWLRQLAQHNDVLGGPSLTAVRGIRWPQSPYAACSLQAARGYALAALTAVPAVCWLPARRSGWGAGAAGEWRSGARGGRGWKDGQGHGTGGHMRPGEKAV
jgi:hypothetical protein